MVSVSGAKQVINLFVRNQGERLITRPKTVQMFVEDVATKLKYVPPLEGDVMTLSPQAKKVAERIAQVKQEILNVKGETATYDEFFSHMPDATENYKLEMWYSLTSSTKPYPKNKLKCMEELAKCFEKENLKKIDFFKNLSEEELQILSKSEGIDKSQIIATITGHKPACFDISDEAINFAKAIQGTKYADEFIAINVKSSPKHFCILNKKQVREIIDSNKEIYCRELGLDINTSTEEVYKKWLKCIENEFPSGEKPLAFGLTLGYPKYSSLIYTLENGFLQNNEKLGMAWVKSEGGIKQEQYKDILLKAIRHEDSPFKNYSEEFKREFEHYVRTEDFRNFMNPFEERFISSFKLHGSDSVDMKHIVENEIDFVNNFRMEQLFS